MAFKALRLRFIRFLGPGKESAEFTFTPGLNILWGSSDTGKTFLVQAIDFMLGAGDPLEDIPERSGYDRVLLGLTVGDKDYTIHRSINGGAFTRFDGLLLAPPRIKRPGRFFPRFTARRISTTSRTGSYKKSGWKVRRSSTARPAAS